MNYADGMRIAEYIMQRVAPACEEIVLAGSLRRRKQEGVHDIEFVLKPKAGRPAPKFGQKVVHSSHLDKLLYEMQDEGIMKRVKGGDRFKQYELDTARQGVQTLNPFCVEFYIVIPPSQWGVAMLIRTGPQSNQNNFSQWCVTNMEKGGRLPDGYKVTRFGVYRLEQLVEKNGKFEPLPGQTPVLMPTEESFLDFLGLGWLAPWDRHARWGR